MDNKKIVAIKKGNVWYIKSPEYNLDWADIRINNKPAIQCPHPDWGSCLEEPRKIERLNRPSNKLVGFQRKVEFASEKLSTPDYIADPEYFSYDDETETYNHEVYKDFYSRVYEKQEPYWEELDWDINLVDADCEPVVMSLPVKIDFPNDIAKYKETHHKYPCRITSDDLFYHVREKIIEKVKASDQLKIDDYKGIGSLNVSRKIGLAQPKKSKRDISGLRARKPKWQYFTRTEEWRTVLDLNAAKYRKSLDVTTPEIRADNYAELQKKVAEYVESIVTPLEDVEICECPQCGGYGYISKVIKEATP